LSEELRHNTAIIIFGRKGYGKTVWMRYYIQKNPERKFIIFDHQFEYDIDDRTIVVNSLQDFKHLGMYSMHNKNKIIIRGRINFENFWIFAATCRGYWIGFDEIDKCCSPTYIPEGLNEICQYGRHHGVNLMVAARRPGMVNRNLTSQADHIICFNIREPRDLKYIQDYAGPEIAEKLPTLEVLEFVRYPEGEKIEGFDS